MKWGNEIVIRRTEERGIEREREERERERDRERERHTNGKRKERREHTSYENANISAILPRQGCLLQIKRGENELRTDTDPRSRIYNSLSAFRF